MRRPCLADGENEIEIEVVIGGARQFNWLNTGD